jgi:predicted RNase H-like HicB family nuclease
MVEYPINIYFVPEDDGKGYWFAYLPDFGWSACSATGETMEAALVQLRNVQQEVMAHYAQNGKQLPKPSPPPFEGVL